MLFEGYFAVHKPTGMSSYDVIRKIKQILGKVKIGHAGTLDPFASGVLVVAVGRKFTKRLDEFQAMQKQYMFTIQLGKITSTLDPEGEVEAECDVNTSLTQAHIEQECQVFVGDIQQMPPAFSAKRINGVRLYKLARQDVFVHLKPVEVRIDNIKFIYLKDNDLTIEVVCQKGTYIRQLGCDIARAMGTVGHLKSLVRTEIGSFNFDNSIQLEDIENWNC